MGPKAKTVADQIHFDQTKIRKCQVAVERLRQDTVTKSQVSVASALTTATQKPDDRSQSSVSFPETHVSLPSRGGDETRDGDDKTSSAGVSSHKSETSSKIVAGDKTTKENKCSSENLEILISKKKGVCDEVAKVSNILSENNCQGKKSSSSSS